MDKPFMDTKFSIWMQILMVIALAGILVLLLFACTSCIPARQLVDYAHEVPVAMDMALEDDNVQGDTKSLLMQVKDTGQAIADKCPPPSVQINKGNVRERLKSTQEEAETWKPWYESLDTSDGLLALVMGFLGIYLGRSPLRKLLHFFTHNPEPIKKEEKA
jgi:hypothetical protein